MRLVKHPLGAPWANEQMRQILEDPEGESDLLVEIGILSMDLCSVSSYASVLGCLPERVMVKSRGSISSSMSTRSDDGVHVATMTGSSSRLTLHSDHQYEILWQLFAIG
jgi:hypothetical protein